MCEPRLDGMTRRGVTRRGVLAGGAAVATATVLGSGRLAHAALALPAAPVTVADGLSIWPRDAWAPGPPTGPIGAEEVRFLLVHHTAAATQHRAAEVPGLLAAMYRFHTGEKAWPDIAYNFLVDREGGVWEGRAGSLAGPVAADATGGSQGFAQLVCFIGDFTGEPPSGAAVAAGTRTLAWLAQRYEVSTAAGATVSFTSRGSNRWPAGVNVTTPTIAGHRDMSTTACPGNAFYPYVRNGLQRDVHALRGGTLSAPPGPATTAPATTAPTTAPATTAPATTAPATSASATTAPAATAAPTTTGPTTTPATAPPPLATSNSTPSISSNSAAQTGAPSTTDSGEIAGAAPDGGSGGTSSAVVPVAAATASVAAVLVWLRQRASRPSADPEVDD
jgi:hypothetical protein